MAALAATIAETIAGMKKVINKDRERHVADPDEMYLQSTNRGNKLKRSAIYGLPASRKAYKRTITHAGFNRDILFDKPLRTNDYGIELASDEEDEDADERATEEDPYAGIRIEDLLRPLTSSAGLPGHPSLSVPYTSSMLSDMTSQTCQIVQRERKTLINAKKMLTSLRGDATWIPCEFLARTIDDEIFEIAPVYRNIVASVPSNRVSTKLHNRGNVIKKLSNEVLQAHTSTDAKSPVAAAASDTSDQGVETKLEIGQTAVDEIRGEVLDPFIPSSTGNDADNMGQRNRPEEASEHIPPLEEAASTNVAEDVVMGVTSIAELSTVQTNESAIDDQELDDEQGEDESDVGSQSPPRRITRAQAQADKLPASSRSPSPEEEIIPSLHPLFLIPQEVKPQADFGLPASEADETRRMLAAYVQKQEEICRGAEKLYDGLLHADRQRKAVFRWSKAEGHIGEMSDGEDWYDQDEWGLDGELRKGHAEEEEETVAQGKKTRGRRA